MDHGQTILVITSFIFGTVLYILSLVKGPGLSIRPNSSHFDKTKLASLYKFLFIVTLVSVPVGYMVTHRLTVTAQYVGLSLLLSAIMGTGIFLQRKGPKVDH